MKIFDEPALRCVGLLPLSKKEMLPVFMPETPTDRPSINTPEGWNALAERMANRENGVLTE